MVKIYKIGRDIKNIISYNVEIFCYHLVIFRKVW